LFLKRCLCMQVKKKMTVDEFIRNNRGINGGEDLPQDFLRDLYHSISRNEIRISTESQAFAAASPVLWAEIKQQSEAPRGVRLETLGLSTCP
jgi:brefeldin A-resistance guanine nucleotide exchange factor 1